PRKPRSRIGPEGSAARDPRAARPRGGGWIVRRGRGEGGAAHRVERIREVVRDIPRGCVASYGQGAEIAGIPRGARQVGYALRTLPARSDVPWHRVVTASGRVAFPPDSASF